MKAVWTDILNQDKDMYWIGSGYYFMEKNPHFFKSWNRKRMEKGIKWFNLMRFEFKENPFDFGNEEKKFLPSEFTNNPTVIGIYGNKVINLLFFEEPFAIVIENKQLADS